jgi:hypothetical protein
MQKYKKSKGRGRGIQINKGSFRCDPNDSG